MNVRDNIGQIQMGIIKKAVWNISGVHIESKQIAPHIICTAAKYNKTTGSHVPLSNCENIENYECITDGGAMVYEYISRTINKALADYFSKMIAIYPSWTQTKAKVSRQKRDRFQTPSTCFWIHTDQPQVIRRVQQLVLSEGGCFWDLSSYIFIERVNQFSGTFLGEIVGHTTLQ